MKGMYCSAAAKITEVLLKIRLASQSTRLLVKKKPVLELTTIDLHLQRIVWNVKNNHAVYIVMIILREYRI
jgi:hypothetical protein